MGLNDPWVRDGEGMPIGMNRGWEECPTCGGEGHIDDGPDRGLVCPDCDGEGAIVSTCPECHNVGYLLNEHHQGEGNRSGPMTLNLTACYYPTCNAEHRPIVSLQVLGMFTNVIRAPDGTIMALDGFTEPTFR